MVVIVEGVEGCGIHVGGSDVIVASVGGLLAWFVHRKSKSPFVDPLSLFAGTKSTVVHGWHVIIGAGSAGCVFWSLLLFAGRRSKRASREFHVIGVWLR